MHLRAVVGNMFNLLKFYQERGMQTEPTAG
jgi:hypothetical protein